MTNQIPFEDIKNIYQLVNEVVLKKNRPQFTSPIPQCYQKLIEDCWNDDPENRPTFDEILSRLSKDTRFIIDGSIDEKEFTEYISFIKSQSAQNDSSFLEISSPDGSFRFYNHDVYRFLSDTTKLKSIPLKSCTFLLSEKKLTKNKSNLNVKSQLIMYDDLSVLNDFEYEEEEDQEDEEKEEKEDQIKREDQEDEDQEEKEDQEK